MSCSGKEADKIMNLHIAQSHDRTTTLSYRNWPNWKRQIGQNKARQRERLPAAWSQGRWDCTAAEWGECCPWDPEDRAFAAPWVSADARATVDSDPRPSCNCPEIVKSYLTLTPGRFSRKTTALSIVGQTTLLRVIQREDYENSKKRVAPLPTAYDKTPTGSYGVSFCSLLQYNLRHRGDFLFSLPFLRNSTPNIGGGHPLGGPKIRV